MPQPAPHPLIRRMGPWAVHEWAEALSTNDLARSLPPWSIARCDVQTSGRGRFNRPWIGAEGGLWCSFTVPLAATGTALPEWGHLPLVAGLAVLDLLDTLEINTGRLRWPNDLLVGNAKLAGILVERPSADMAVIGIGINAHNSMEDLRGKTKDPAVSIAILTTHPPTLPVLLEQLGHTLEQRFTQFAARGLPALAADLQRAWDGERPVTIQTDEGDITGTFRGIDASGNPVLRVGNGSLNTIPAHLVNRLVEN